MSRSPTALVATVATPDRDRRRRPVRMPAVQRGFRQPRPARKTRAAPFAQRASGEFSFRTIYALSA